ncbi:uncharacterized protein LOC133519523 [Cydia pomonella]|uniref:uncharacterized protein LOC133519523 n=1 Tax=Cydia pomonella TaxID=82600 RepID=UPI002ADE6B48|nr:uncharacterized protein LOC133519523 [Cydia pomonella]
MGSKQLIANELLAFVQNAIDTMDEVSIRQICKSSFSEDDICSGKALLFQTLGKTDQMPSRRRDGGVKSLQDIIKVLKETDPDDVPAFVAKRLDRLPPVTFDHVDVTRLLKDITFLKTSLTEMQSKLEVANKTICELRVEVATLRDTVSECRSHEATDLGSGSDARAIMCNAGSATSDMTPVPAGPPPAPRTPRRVLPSTAPVGVSATPHRDYAAAAKLRKAPSRVPEHVSRDEKPPRAEKGFTQASKERRPRKAPRKSQCGTAEPDIASGLRVATPNTALYVSRLHVSATAEDVVEYVRKKIRYELKKVSRRVVFRMIYDQNITNCRLASELR